MGREQRPTSGHLNKRPAHNHKGIGGSGLLPMFAHFSLYAPLKDYCPAIPCITPLDAFGGVL